MTQTHLFTEASDICANRHRGSETSQLANRRVDKEGGRNLVLHVLDSLGTATLDEICEMTGLPPNCLSGRVSELKASGLIEDTGLRRKTRTGATAKVFKKSN